MRILFSLFIAAMIAFPIGSFAHGEMMEFQDVHGGTEMMQYVEGQALGPELHDEMEGLMVKMMAGKLSEAEAGRMAELMNQYPGPQAMMMSRMMGAGSVWGMMPWTWGSGTSGWSWVLILLYLVWLVVGALAVVWLWQNISKK